jgi:hypothetical protein
MTTPYTIAAYDLERIARDACGTITCKVLGYWSVESISLYVRRNWFVDGPKGSTQWNFQVTHASGGRDNAAVPSDLEAATYFGMAIIAIAELGRQLATQTEQLEAWYQDQKAKYQAEAEAERATMEARVAADPEIGAEAARVAVDAAMASVRNTGKSVEWRLIQRGCDHGNTIKIVRKPGSGVVRIYFNSYPSSRQECIGKVAQASQRTVLETA